MKLGYQIFKRDKELIIGIVIAESYSERLLEFRWLADRSIDHWFGFGIETDGLRSQFNQGKLSLVAKLLQKLDKWLDENDQSPQSILNWLQNMRGMDRAVYDGRLNSYIYLSELSDPSWGLWRDSNNNCHVIASNELMAKQKLVKAVMDYSITSYDTWVKSGKEVEQLNGQYNRFNGDIRPIHEIMEYPFK